MPSGRMAFYLIQLYEYNHRSMPELETVETAGWERCAVKNSPVSLIVVLHPHKNMWIYRKTFFLQRKTIAIIQSYKGFPLNDIP